MITILRLSSCAALLLASSLTAASDARLTINAAAAAPTAFATADTAINLSGGGGFQVLDAARRVEVKLARGTVTLSGTDATFATSGEGVRLAARFESRPGHVLVTGEIENLTGDERGFILDYRLPRFPTGAVFSHHLEESVTLDDAAGETEANAFPLAAMCGPEGGLALAISPEDPRVFGLVGDRRGLAVRFYLGTSPLTRRFPNRAPFAFVIYNVDPAWGFRSALSRYYGFYPDFYQQRLKKEGLMMFQMTDRLPENIDHYGFHLSETHWDRNVLLAALARDEEHAITTFPYMIVGQREIKFLPEVPRTYAEAMTAYARWDLALHAARPHTKENACAEGDVHLREEVDASACHTAFGRHAIVIRDTPWGEKSVTFKVNPNPDLFADLGRANVGSRALAVADRWIAQHPRYDGLFIDSLGANWPAVLNYRSDHFAYARYPLTCDPNGKVALSNVISHYEFVADARRRMYASQRLTLGNGVYAYPSRGSATVTADDVEFQLKSTTMTKDFHKVVVPPEHYRTGVKVSPFFIAALLDVASSEWGVKAEVPMFRDVRVMLGRKPYAFLNYHWEDGAAVAEFVNKSLAYGVFASSNTNWGTGVQYEINENGYYRDRKLLDWYVPLVRRLSAAGWEPVRHAAVTGDSVSSERFGQGERVYFTLFNDGTTPTAATLKPDLAALGFAEAPLSIAEIARAAEMYQSRDGTLHLKLEPKKTYVIEVRRSAAL